MASQRARRIAHPITPEAGVLGPRFARLAQVLREKKRLAQDDKRT